LFACVARTFSKKLTNFHDLQLIDGTETMDDLIKQLLLRFFISTQIFLSLFTTLAMCKNKVEELNDFQEVLKSF
jgi:hypothetical protein